MKISSLFNHRRTVAAGLSFLLIAWFTGAFCQTRVRTEMRIPDIPGYKTLKCDFHIHTIYSDGNVKPHIRAEEAWREGFDAISITDHVEDDGMKDQHNRSYDLALSRANSLGIILIRGGEITRSMPPGHFNAIFLKDVTPLDTEDYRDAIEAAINQGAYVFWNHPGWTGQQSDGISRWYDHQAELYDKGWLHGIEVVNERDYYPRVFQWCLDKKLTLMGNSDIHDPIQMEYDFHQGDHRAVTLVFAEEKSEKAIKKALFARRTAVYSKNLLIGEEIYLKPLFEASVKIVNPVVSIHGDGRTTIQIRNCSDVSFDLIAEGELEEISFPRQITLYANKTVLLRVSGKSESLSGTKELKLPYKVKNCLIAPELGLPVTLPINITFHPEK
jgi:hypothetical protein